jgi:hypothetical protein
MPKSPLAERLQYSRVLEPESLSNDMRRRLSVLAVLCVVALLWLAHRSPDGPWDLLLAAVLPDDTVYATDYSDKGFRAVHVGMTDAEVRHLIGEPIVQVWRYGDFEGRDGATSRSPERGQLVVQQESCRYPLSITRHQVSRSTGFGRDCPLLCGLTSPCLLHYIAGRRA